MQKQITINDKEYLLVEEEVIGDLLAHYHFIGTDNKLYANYGQLDFPVDVELPTGTWEIIGKGDKLHNLQWMDIVERVPNTKYFVDYEAPDSFKYALALQSGNSLIRSQGFKPEGCLILKLVK